MSSIQCSVARRLSTLRVGVQATSRKATSRNLSTSSVDDREIQHFDALASTWWDPHGSSRLLHLMNPLRHDFISSCRSHSSSSSGREGLNYLDIGCGGGIFAESASRLPSTESVTAIDPSESVIGVARLHAHKDPSLRRRLASRPPSLSYLNADIEGFAAQTQSQYDVVSLFEVLEHVPHPSDFLKSCLPLVKPGGWIVLSTIARTWTSWFTTKLVAEDLIRLVPPGTHDWSKYISPHELEAWFAKQQQWTQRQPGGMHTQGVVYVPGFGWKFVPRAEQWGNYFFGVQRTSN